ncbi:MAG TPA: hypothetical protein VJB59_16070 [Bdellovibrionota bacterium]|nr:hypothetical protein [Bdellovibrionota bacterium]
MRGPHVNAFYGRYRMPWKHQSAIHVAHGAAHDVFELAHLQEHEKTDERFNAEMLEGTLKHPPKTEAEMQTYGPYIGQSIWQLYRAIDWTHIHHGATYDVMSSDEIAWDQKKEWTDKTVRHYLEKLDVARSPAPLDVTMRRAGVMMKPYFTYFRNYYPKSNNYFYAAHWWHPVIYEAMMLGGNGKLQDEIVRATDELTPAVFKDPPLRMPLSREIMPRYAQMSPESANIFDNLHMLHGIAYDIMAYPNWSLDQKKAELNRVVRAMAYQPGDEKLARKFSIPHPEMDPRRYEAWMKTPEGSMTDIMEEMMLEMMPMMMPNITASQNSSVMAQLKMKLTPGMQEGEIQGSLHDALMKIMPEIKMAKGAMEPGESSPEMMNMMMAGWTKKHGMIPDAPMIAMDKEPGATVRSVALTEGGSQ